MSGEETGIKVRAYASDAYLFHRDFARTMMTKNLHRFSGSGPAQLFEGGIEEIRKKDFCSVFPTLTFWLLLSRI